MEKIYKILVAVAICAVPWLLSGCEDKEDAGSGWVEEPVAKSDPVDDVNPYEPMIYVDLDMDFSTMSLDEYDNYVNYVQSILSPAYSDHLFSDDAVYTRFSADGGEKVIIPERGCTVPKFRWATSHDILNDDASDFKCDVRDWNGNSCFRIDVWERLIREDKLPLQAGDIISVKIIPPGSTAFETHGYKELYYYLDERGVEKMSDKESTPSFPKNDIMVLKPGVDKWLEVAIDGRRRTITLKASPNDTGVKRVATIVMEDKYRKRCRNGVVESFDMLNSQSYINNSKRVEQAAE